VGYKKTWLQVQAADALRVWEKTRLQPYAARKNFSYLVLCPFAPHSEAHKHTERFFQSLTATYEVCHLGHHRPAPMSKFRVGFVHYHSAQATTPREQLVCLERACRALGQEVGQCKTYADNSWLVYVVHPFTSPRAPMEVTRCAAALQTTPHPAAQINLVVQVLAYASLLHPPCGPMTLAKEVALSVFTKCRRIAYRGAGERPGYQLYEPYCILSTPTPASLHCAYRLSLDGTSLLVVLTDSRGELLEHRVLPYRPTADMSLPTLLLSACLEYVEELPQAVSFASFAIGKLGSFTPQELDEWNELWQSPPWHGSHRFKQVCLFSVRWSRGGTQWYHVPSQAHGPPQSRAVYPPPRFTAESPTLSSYGRVAMICPPSPSIPQTLQIHLYRHSATQSEESVGTGRLLRDLTHQLWALTFLNSSPAFLHRASHLPFHFAILLRFTLLLDAAGKTK